MGFFDSIQKPGFKAAKGKNSHVEQQVTKVAPPSKPSISLSQRLNNRQLPNKSVLSHNANSAKSSPRYQASNFRKRPAASTPQPLESDSDDDVSGQDIGTAKKRTRRASDVEADLDRQIRCRKAFSTNDGGSFPMVHGADVASSSKSTKFKAAFPHDPQVIEVCLQYPSDSQRERYVLRLRPESTELTP